jgi:hypothetical protein
VERWWEEGKGRGLFGWQAAIPAALCARLTNAESGKRLGASMARAGRGCHIRPLLPGEIYFYFYPADFYFHSLTSTTSVYTPFLQSNLLRSSSNIFLPPTSWNFPQEQAVSGTLLLCSNSHCLSVNACGSSTYTSTPRFKLEAFYLVELTESDDDGSDEEDEPRGHKREPKPSRTDVTTERKTKGQSGTPKVDGGEPAKRKVSSSATQ